MAHEYPANLVGAGTRFANLSQAMNQAFNDQGKSCGALLYNGKRTLRVSTGVSSVTLFHYELATVPYLFAMGQHRGSSSYDISDFGPDTGDFKSGKPITLVWW